MDEIKLKVLKLLSKQYPTIAEASTEIINLQSILNLPCGTEHFISDVHGEYEQFNHVIRNGSGAIRRKIDEEFGNTIRDKEKKALAALIYYPEEKLTLIQESEDNIDDWYRITLHRLVAVTKRVASKYTRSKVRKALPKDFAYVIEELITEKEELEDKELYYNEIIATIIRIGRAPDFIIALSELIQRLVVDHLHLVGDIFDRGPGPHIIMDTLMQYHSVDIEWGNHDIVWMGAAAGSETCIASVIRFAVRYGNLNTLEEGYGINLVPLATFAMETYKNVDCSRFRIRYNTEYDTGDLDLDMMMHKAITIIMLKLEGQLIKRNPDFKMDKRLLFEHVDWEKKTVTVDGKTYDMLDTDFPTVDPADPYKLTDEEEAVVKKLRHAFRHSEKLQKHVRFLYSKGSLYRIHDGNLIYHGCVPLDPDGSFMNVNVCGTEYHGRKLYDVLESYARKAYYLTDDPVEKKKGQDILYYIWAGPCSPVFGKAKMATFESYFIADKEASVETKNSYYDLYEKEEVVDSIIKEFGLDSSSAHIINGHVPVEVKKGDTPLKCGGKLLIIDGGFAKAYQSKTGIAGYTLIVNSHGMWLSALEPFESKEAAIHDETDIVSESILVEQYSRRHFVADSDKGREIRKNIADLEDLLEAYRDGVIIEKEK